MSVTHTYDAVVVGAGPNGLAAAIELARNGCSVAVLEANDQVGGGARSGELTLPGFVHDLGSAIHPLGFASPFFRSLPLGEHGLEWVHPAAPLAHPFDDGTATVLEHSMEETAGALGVDADAYRKLMQDVAEDVDRIAASFVGRPRVPRHPLALLSTGLRAVGSARGLAERLFAGEKVRGLFAGNAAHSFLPLERRPAAMFGFVNGVLGHARGYGWPFPKGGSQEISDALASYLLSLGGDISTGVRVTNVDEVPRARAVLFDVTPRQLLDIAGKHFTDRYRHALERYRYGPGLFKADFALDGPVPWKAGECLRAGTVHLGGTLEEIAAGEAAVWRGEHPEQPFVLLAQQSLFDRTRAPEAQIERFAPGFKDRILAKSAMDCTDLERSDANLVGGDITGGVMDLRGLLARPALRVNRTRPRRRASTSARLRGRPAPGYTACAATSPPARPCAT